jgi:hypothetical protein
VVLDDEISTILPAAHVSCHYGRSLGRGQNTTTKVDEVGNCGAMEEVSFGKGCFSIFISLSLTFRGEKTSIPLLHPRSPVIDDSIDKSLHVVF